MSRTASTVILADGYKKWLEKMEKLGDNQWKLTLEDAYYVGRAMSDRVKHVTGGTRLSFLICFIGVRALARVYFKGDSK